MGWTYMHRDKGLTTADFLLRDFDKGTVFHATGLVNGVFYAAVETPPPPRRGLGADRAHPLVTPSRVQLRVQDHERVHGPLRYDRPRVRAGRPEPHR